MNWSAVVDTYYNSNLKPGDVKVIPWDDFRAKKEDTIMVVLSVEWLPAHEKYRFTMLTPEGIFIRERRYNEYYDKNKHQQ